MTYAIVRMRPNRPAVRLRGYGRLTLQEAQAHCSRDDTHGGTYCFACNYKTNQGALKDSCPKCGGQSTGRAWFDGYEER